MTTNPNPVRTTPAYVAQSWISFAIAFGSLILGTLYLTGVSGWTRAFLAVAVCYLVTSCFTLAKVVRDQQEHSQIYSRIDQARVEKLLAEHDPFAA